MYFTSKTMLSVVSALVVTALLCMGIDATAQSLPVPGPAPSMDAPREAQLAWSLSHRAYRTQLMLDGSTTIYEYRTTDAGGHGIGPSDRPVRRVDPRHHTYLRWLASGRKAIAMPAEKERPKPRITATQLRAQANEMARPEREALEVCRAEVFAAEVAGSLVAPDCTAVVEMWQMRVEQAEEALRGRYEVVR